MSAAAPPPAEPARPGPSLRWLALPITLGALVAVTLGLIAREEAISPGTYPGGYFRLFFSDPTHLKAWLASLAVFLACCQVLTGAWIFRWLPFRRPRWIPAFHRWTGRLAFLATLPVAYHCIFKLGFLEYDTRVAAHSFLGSAIYGAFAAKVTIVRLHRFPGWALPLAGGILFAVLVTAWYTSAVWFLEQVGWQL